MIGAIKVLIHYLCDSEAELISVVVEEASDLGVREEVGVAHSLIFSPCRGATVAIRAGVGKFDLFRDAFAFIIRVLQCHLDQRRYQSS